MLSHCFVTSERVSDRPDQRLDHTPRKASKPFVNQVDALNSSDEVEHAFREFSTTHFGRRKRPSMRARFASLISTCPKKIPEHYDAQAVQLLISWRNRHVHGRSTENVSDDIKQMLMNASSKFHDDHSHLNIERMLDNYTRGNAPTLKEVSSLISIAHRVVWLRSIIRS